MNEEREDSLESGMGELPATLFDERERYTENDLAPYHTGRDIPPDIGYQSDALTRSRGGALGAPVELRRITSTFDARPINARDFTETLTGQLNASYELTTDTLPIVIDEAFEGTFTVPQGYIAILRGFDYRVLEPSKGLIGSSFKNAYNISIAGGTTGPEVSILIDESPAPNYDSITGLGFRQNELVPGYILADAGQRVTLKIGAPKNLDFPAFGTNPYLNLEWETQDTTGIDEGNFAIEWSPDLRLFVAVNVTNAGNRVMTSPDAITWTLRATPADLAWIDVVWSPELRIFVAVRSTSPDNRFMVSQDGINWSLVTTANTDGFAAIAWSPELGLFAAVGSKAPTNVVMLSDDGNNWFTAASSSDKTWNDIVWAPELNLFVAIASAGAGDRVMTSPDGLTWTDRTAASANFWRKLAWSPELLLFAAVSSDGVGTRVMTSPDGITWTTRTSAADNSWRDVEWSPQLSLFIAVAASGTGDRVMTSPDGITWTLQTSAADNDWQGVTWSPELGLFAAVSDDGVGNRVMTSESALMTYNVNSSLYGNLLLKDGLVLEFEPGSK